MRLVLPFTLSFALACSGGAPAKQADPIVSFTVTPAVLHPGDIARLVPVFTAGAARIEPGVGIVETGQSYAVGPFASAQAFSLVVDVGAESYAREVAVPLRYRERVSSIAPGSARTRHGAATLSDGRILLVGGASVEPTFWADSEIYDPRTGVTSPAGTLSTTRAGTAVVALPDGSALRFGGEISENTFEMATRVEAWDPSSSSWTIAGHLVSNRTRHTATRLPDGRILIAGGLATGGRIEERDAEIWVPGMGSRQPAGEMVQRRAAHTATLLRDGRVLLAGGYSIGTGEGIPEAELFDPVTETFTSTGRLAETRAYHDAVLLPSGHVLVVGGDVVGDGIRRSAELWDPTTGRFQRVGDLATARTELDAVLLGSGEVLVSGGLVAETTATASLEIWDPATGAFRAAAQAMPAPRAGLTAHVLADARVLLVGGDPGDGFPIATAVHFD